MGASLEHHTIYQIPSQSRHGRPRDQFTIWFSTNMTLLTVVTGALGPTEGHLSFLNSVLALLLGSLIGGVFMALHAAQGPALGVPQMIQSRGQFGSWGALPVVAMVIVMYVGFVASNCVVGGDAIHYALPHFTSKTTIILMALLSLIPCIFGYKFILSCSKPVTFFTFLAVIICFIQGVVTQGATLMTDLHGTVAGFAQTFSIAVLWQISYAPYVSDSSRYLPSNPKTYRATFWACYGGTVSGSVLAMSLGAFLAAQSPSATIIEAIHSLMGAWGVLIVGILGISIALANAMDLYCSTLSTITFFHTFAPLWQPRAPMRISIGILTLVIALSSALFMSQAFNTAYAALLDILMAVMIPWTAINLVDFYILRHGNYHVPSFFQPNGGQYGRVNVYALISYSLGVIVEIPFINLPFYKGSLLASLHNVDISWFVSLICSSITYIIMNRKFQ
ncbi:cytosine permease [Saccharibacter sp. 17.LH.SD]|nr:cytosine permease [Saccharibacter sp. 17.LH.SD]